KGLKLSRKQSLFEKFNYKESQKITQAFFLENIIKAKQGFFAYAIQGMINFNFLKLIQLKFINQMTYSEEVPFGAMLLAQVNHIYIFAKKLYYYRIRKGSLVNYSGEKLDVCKHDLKDYQVLQNHFIYDRYRKKSNLFLATFIFLNFLKKGDFENKDLLEQVFINQMNIWRLEIALFHRSYWKKSLYLSFKKLFDFSNDIDLNLQFISELINDNMHFLCKYGGAKARIQNELPYKLGQIMIRCSKSLSGIILMPFYILSAFLTYKQEQKIYEEKIEKKSSLELPPLERYPDYHEALRVKKGFAYKLGEALIKANNNWYGGGVYQIVV
ncbi:hypothetical protein H2254_07515, partial [Campylobacter sp. RM9759]|nr:hypothetical protein [Campylobacter sp. RM9759]